MSDTENTPVPADDTEGHRMAITDQPGQDDVQGHRMAITDEPADDVEGHRHIKATEEPGQDDVEGHRMLRS